jgi:hypothetical protein
MSGDASPAGPTEEVGDMLPERVVLDPALEVRLTQLFKCYFVGIEPAQQMGCGDKSFSAPRSWLLVKRPLRSCCRCAWRSTHQAP